MVLKARSGGRAPSLRFDLWLLCALAWGFALAYFVSAEGRLDANGHAVGRDFVNVWTAGQLIAQDRTLDIFDPARFLAAERELFHPDLPFHFWSYPPTALATAAPLGGLGYFQAYALWCAAGLGLVAVAGAAFLRDRAETLLLLASPAAATNLVLGQNGYLTAALLLGYAALVAKRPLAAGGLAGLLTFKPQLGLLIPVAALAQKRWRVFAAAIVTASLLAAATTAAFGLESWHAFMDRTLPMQMQMMAAGTGAFQLMAPSAFMGGRILGLDSGWAVALQIPFTLAGAWLAWRAARRGSDPVLAGAVLLAATFAATPQAFNYDLIPAAAAALVLARRSETALDRWICLAAWLLPLVVLALNRLHVPLGPVILLLLAWRLDVQAQLSLRPPQGSA